MPEFTEPQQAENALMDFLAEAIKSGRWLVTISHVQDNMLHHNRVTWDFPIDNVRGALEKIESDLKTLTPPAPSHPSLQVADWLQQVQEDRAKSAEVEDDPDPTQKHDSI